MPDKTATLSACLQKARELRITEGFSLFVLIKCPGVAEYRLINTSESNMLRLWLLQPAYKFVCIIDVLDIMLIDSALPITQLHELFTECETLTAEQRTCVELIDFLDLLKERDHATPPTIPS